MYSALPEDVALFLSTEEFLSGSDCRELKKLKKLIFSENASKLELIEHVKTKFLLNRIKEFQSSPLLERGVKMTKIEAISQNKDRFSADTLIIKKGSVFLVRYSLLPLKKKLSIESLCNENSIKMLFIKGSDTLVLPQFIYSKKSVIDLAEKIGKILNYVHPRELQLLERYHSFKMGEYKEIDFDSVLATCKKFASFLRENFLKICDILLSYESYQVVSDEFERTLDLMESIDENRDYFIRYIKQVAVFLPRNQPLYAFACFAIIPSLMSEKVFVKPPKAMSFFFHDLIDSINVEHFFPNISVWSGVREDFIKLTTKRVFNQKMSQLIPSTDAVIFTGTMQNADEMRKKYDKRTLFIANGAGHNPVVITRNANVNAAVDSVVRLQLYNQGQDCANPSAILVHESLQKLFIAKLKKKVAMVKVGEYSNKRNIVGPISDVGDFPRIQLILLENRQWIDSKISGRMNVRNGIVEPALINKPLYLGGNFNEQFAPIFFVQSYKRDQDLSLYFEDPKYRKNAMYITIFGKSDYINNMVEQFKKNGLHDEMTIIKNTDLHAPGVERGVKPYGGYGRGASSLSINGIVISKPTLPQRDIYEHLVRPFINIE